MVEVVEEPPAAEMSFLEHLDELRTRLIRCFIAIGITFLLGWFFSDRIFQVLSIPVEQALGRARAAQLQRVPVDAPPDLASAEPGVEVQYTFVAPISVGGVSVPAGTTIWARVEFDRDGTVAAIVPTRPWGVGRWLLQAGSPIPIEIASGTSYTDSSERLVIETVQGSFNLYVKVAFYTAVVLSVPFLLFQIWGFVAPGLYPHERRYAWPFVFMTSLFFALGVLFAYKVAFPAACDYLVGLSGEHFTPLINAAEYFDLILIIMLGLGLVFQIPTITYFLARIGLVTAGTLIRIWRYAVIVIFILAAVLSPTADVPNMLVFAAPMILLYILSIGIAWFFHRQRRTEAEVAEEA